MCSNGIHGHHKGVSLGGALLGKQYLSINKELWIVSIGVNEHLGQGRAFLLDAYTVFTLGTVPARYPGTVPARL